jgi:hypothetical protein
MFSFIYQFIYFYTSTQFSFFVQANKELFYNVILINSPVGTQKNAKTVRLIECILSSIEDNKIFIGYW